MMAKTRNMRLKQLVTARSIPGTWKLGFYYLVFWKSYLEEKKFESQYQPSNMKANYHFLQKVFREANNNFSTNQFFSINSKAYSQTYKVIIYQIKAKQTCKRQCH